MGPHIKRARIALVLVGIVYLFTAYRSFGTVTTLRALVTASSSSLGHQIDLAYYFVIATIVAGLGNLVLAAIGGTRTTAAMYIATAVFAGHSLFELSITGALLLTSWLWWLTAICLGMGFQAAWKADQRRNARPS